MSTRAGVALLEALVALTVLGTAGLATVAVLGAGLQDARRAQRTEAELATAARVLSALTLLTRAELAQRVGRYPLGEFLVDIQQPAPALYRIALRRDEAPALEVLVTVVYRP